MLIATARAVVCDGMRAIIANYVPSILTARAVDIADYQMFVGAYGNTPGGTQRGAIGDGKPCITAGKPTRAQPAESVPPEYVPRSGTTLFDIFDAEEVTCPLLRRFR